MRISSAALVSLALAAVPSVARAESSGEVQLEFEVFRIHGDISGSTSLTDSVWRELQDANPLSREYPFSVFTIADQTLGGVKFKADENGWTWDDKKEPAAGSRVTVIARPRLLVRRGQPFELSVTSQPLQYFTKRADGLYELRKTEKSPGLSLQGTIREKDSGERIVLENLTFTSRFVERRKPIPGLAMDVGEPVIVAREERTTLALQPGRDYGMRIRIRDGQGSLLCRIRVSPAKPEDAAQ